MIFVSTYGISILNYFDEGNQFIDYYLIITREVLIFILFILVTGDVFPNISLGWINDERSHLSKKIFCICRRAFGKLKQELIAPMLISQNWINGIEFWNCQLNMVKIFQILQHVLNTMHCNYCIVWNIDGLLEKLGHVKSIHTML